MSNGTQGHYRFICPKCEAPYLATHEQFPTRQRAVLSGDCRAMVHEWDGDRNYFNWKMVEMKPLSRGKL